MHVITEADVTYSGERKGFLIEQHWERFAQFAEKIRYFKVSAMPVGDAVRRGPTTITAPCDSDRWAREHYQRDALSLALDGLAEDDVLLLSDLDEIVRPDAFDEGVARARAGQIARPRLAMHVYRMRYRWPQAWPGIARFFSPATLAHYGGSVQKVRLQEGVIYGPQEPQDAHGWHLAYMGGREAIQSKLRCAAHHELDVPAFNNDHHVDHSIATGADLFNRGARDAELAPLESLPLAFAGNLSRYGHLL
jgi:beta-1,4-mannosyl-glycoprotein beta-1,4-N-acetylglucosaminyltransferase